MKKFRILLIALILILGGMFASKAYAVDEVRTLNIREFRPFTNMKYEYTVPNSIKYTVHKIFDTERDVSQVSTAIFSKALYCLRGGVGFGAQNANDNQTTYIEFGDMYENAQDILMLYEGYYGTQLEGTQEIVLNNVTYNVNIYNAILWILDEAYLPVDKLNSEGETVYNQEEYKKELLDKAGIPTSQQEDITKDEIEVIQQLAIWYFTNYNEQKDGVVPTLSQPTRFPAQFLTVTDINGNSSNNMDNTKEGNLNKLYQYFIYGAINNWDIYSINGQTGVRTKNNSQNENYFDKTVELGIESVDEETRLPDPNAHYYLIGPFKIKLGENERADAVISTEDIILYDAEGNAIGKFYDIDGVGVNPVCEFLQSDKTTVVDEIIKGEEYYIKVYKLFTEGFTLEGTNLIPEEARYALDENSIIKLKTSSIYSMSKATFLVGENGDVDQPVVEIEKEKIVEEDEITNEIPKKFDLSLRKYITKINNIVLTETRVPEINVTPLNSDETTAEYKHRKDPVQVKKGDLVTYNITIYNEGEKAGRVTKIIDQLPTGLTYSNINTAGFIVSYDENTNQVIITRDSRETTNLPAYENGNLSSETIEIECQVVAETQDTILTNVAWIAEAYDAEDSITITDQKEADRDSEPSTTPSVNKDNMEDYKGTTNETDLSQEIYYPGEQDDDDFEKLILEQETEVKVEKVWSDNNNQDGVRPTSIKVQLLANGQVKEEVELSENNNWEYTFKNLPVKENGVNINYEVEENDTNGYSKTIEEITQNGSVNKIFKITNTYIPMEMQVVGIKKWEDNNNQDGVRPESIKIQLVANGEVKEEVELSEENNWEYEFENLPVKKDGENINYEIEEMSVPEGYEKTIKETTPEGSTNKYIEIINTYIPEETEVTVTKKWVDNENQDGIRPASVKIQLLANGEVKEEVELSEENNWKYTFEKLPVKENGEEISYSVEETEVPEGYGKTIKETTEEGNTNKSFEITNTYIPEETEVTVTKKWEDNENQDGIRPASVKVQLLANGEVKEEVELNKENNWKYTFEKLPVKENGLIINYEVEENVVPEGYGKTIKETTEEGNTNRSFEITNTYIPEETKVTVIKKWVDNENQDGIRPASVKVQLLANGEVKEEVELNKENNWKHTFEKLPVKENGLIINYEVEENVVPEGYGKTIKETTEEGSINRSFEITNTYIPEETEVTVTKKWADNNDQDGIRPNNIKVQLLANGEVKEEIELSEENNWKYTFKGLPVKENGQEISYEVEEIVPEGYEKSIKETTKEGSTNISFEITNTHICKEFDLALRKFITSIKRNGEEVEFDSREPKIDTTTLLNGTTATYEHSKEPLIVKKGDVITYTLRIYNEGQKDGYAEEITDYIPEGLALILGYKENSWWHLQEGIDYNEQLISLVGETNGFYKTEEDVKNIKIEDFEDGIVTDLKDVKLATGKVSITTSKLSKEMDSEDNLIKAFDSTLTKETAEEGWQEAEKGEGGLYYKDVQVSCLVIAENTCKETLTNIAEITEDEDEKGKDVIDRDSTPDNVIENNEDDDDYEPVILRYYDLALRKFITGVERNGKSEEITSRIPVPKVDENGKIQYEHTKDPVHVANNDIVTYTIRVYNEGTMEAYAEEITDDIPEGLEYLPEHEINKKYEWVMVDKEGNITDKVEEAEKITTDYLSEEKEESSRKVIVDEETGETVESETRYNKLRPYDNSKPISTEEPLNPDYKDVKVAFKVIEPNTADDRIIINSAQITEDNGEDEDSDTENWNEGEDDQDREYIEVDWFDLSLLKWVTKTIVTVDGKTTTTETGFEPNTGKTETEGIRDNETPEPVAKVEIDRKKINKTTVKFVYSIRVTNEGNIAGYATEITDYIPEGLEFIESDNTAFGWQKEGDSKVTTRALETVLLQPGESANVEIVFRWKNDSNNLGVKTNVAEITEDYNDNDAKDIDSTVDNKVDPYEEEQEDDDDFALVLLTIKTGKGTTYTVLIMSIIITLAGGVYLIRKYVLTY